MIPDVKGEQVCRDSPDNAERERYEELNKQYATSSYGEAHRMSPNRIVRALDVEDVKNVIKYARKEQIAVAIRTGGHQYSGASSTSGKNILLDMIKFEKNKNSVDLSTDPPTLTVSVSYSLSDFNTLLGNNSMFVPHGQCGNVYLGGHVQTGGYGQLGRSFGLLGDHIVTLYIVDSHGVEKSINRNNEKSLFNAILGGSPGNFCVITHITFRVYRDSDYSGSRGHLLTYVYKTSTLKNLLDIMVDMAIQRNFPQNYDYCVSVLSAGNNLTTMYPILEKKDYRLKGTVHQDAVIFVFVQWVQLDNSDTLDSRGLFEQIRNCGDIIHEYNKEVMSEITKLWISNCYREFDEPYIKRTYVTNSKNYLRTTQWSSWVAKRVHQIIKIDKGCKVSAQMQNFGGRRSKLFINRSNGTSYSWRDSSITCVMDCFHSPEEDYRVMAQEWQDQNDIEGIGEGGIFSKRDMRVLWGSYGSFNLDECSQLYYDDDEKYERLRNERAREDPDNVFTPNTFCVSRQ